VYPTGQDPAFVEAGPYTFYMYFTSNDPTYQSKIRVEVGYCNPDGSGYVVLLQTGVVRVYHNASQPVVIGLGSAPRLQFNASNPKRMRLHLNWVGAHSLNVSYNNIPMRPTRLEIPHLEVPENAFILLFVAPVVPAAIHKLRSSRKRRNLRLHGGL